MAFPSRSPMPDPLDLKQVQGLAECELNERVESPYASSRAAKAALTLVVGVSVGALTARLAFGLLCEEIAVAWRISLLVGAAYLAVVWVAHASHLRYATSVFALWIFVGLFAWGQSYLVGPVHTVRVALVVSAVVSLVCTSLVTEQYVFYATANMSHPWEKSLRWRTYWKKVNQFQAVPSRPDVTSFRRRTLIVAAGVTCGLAMSRSPQPLTTALLGYAAVVAGTALLFWPQGVSPFAALRASIAAVRMFLSYLPTPIFAPGVFQLPTKWLRRFEPRQALCVLALLPLAWATTNLPPIYTAPPKTVSRSFNRGATWEQLPPITEDENDFLNSLPFDDQEDYVRVLIARRKAETRFELSSRNAYTFGLLASLVAGSLLPPAVFLLTLFATSGPLLGAFHTAFEKGSQE